MGLETTVDYLDDLEETYPLDADSLSEADNHMRNIKKALKQTFLGAGGQGFEKAILTTEDELNLLSGLLAAAAELNILDGATLSTAEINYLAGVTLGQVIASKAVTAGATGRVDMQGNRFDNAQLQSYSETVDVQGSIAGSLILSMGDANVHTCTLTVAVTSVLFNNPPATDIRGSFTLEVSNPDYDITWPASVKWPAGVTPPKSSGGASALDIYMFTTTDGGSTWMGFQVGFNMS